MDILRTPDTRFAGLHEYAFASHYLDQDGVRMHYVDEGPRAAPPILLLHGEPSWSYLYRKMIPILVAAGYRAIAPDLIGFGRSDKPAHAEDHTLERHVTWMRGLLDALDIHDTTLVGHDWGGTIGMRLAAECDSCFSRIVASNTFLPTGDDVPSKAFLRWQRYAREAPRFQVGGIIRGGCMSIVQPEVVAAYEAPFPDEHYLVGARQFPQLVPASPADPTAQPNRQAWEVLRQWERPFLCVFSDSDPVTRGGDHVFRTTIPGAQEQPHVCLKGAGHFLQEDKGEEFANIIVAFIQRTPHHSGTARPGQGR